MKYFSFSNRFPFEDILKCSLFLCWSWQVSVSLQKLSILDKCCSFELSLHQRIIKKWYTTVFNIDDNQKCFLYIIYIYAFSRRFYPKRLTLHSSYSFYIFLLALAFPGNRTHDLGVASAMLYQLSYRKAYNAYYNALNAYYNDFWRSCDTEDWSNDAENTAALHRNKLHC